MSNSSRKRYGSNYQSKGEITAEGRKVEIILLEWHDCGEHFLREIYFSSQRNDVQIHVFFHKSQLKGNIDSVHGALTEYCIFHESLTTKEDAPWTDLVAYLVNFYTKVTMSSEQCFVSPNHQRTVYHVTLVSRDQGKYSELKALLRSNKTRTLILDGRKNTLLDVFPHVCVQCKIIFKNEIEAGRHDKRRHNFLCVNRTCERSQRENGFYTKQELCAHMTQQKKCKFCDRKLFCDIARYNEHMKRRHILCECPCRRYYENIEAFVEHYITVYPLPCLENAQCKTRFKNIDDQAFHHKVEHSSVYPYYCLACYGRQKLVCLRTSEELMRHVSDTGHTEECFEIIVIPGKH